MCVPSIGSNFNQYLLLKTIAWDHKWFDENSFKYDQVFSSINFDIFNVFYGIGSWNLLTMITVKILRFQIHFFNVGFVGVWLFVFGLDWFCPPVLELDAAAWFFGWPIGAGFVDLTWFWFEGTGLESLVLVAVWFDFNLFASFTSLWISCFCCVINASLLRSSLSKLV